MNFKKLTILALLLVPLVVTGYIKYHFDFYDDLAERYDCYPFDGCKIDIDGDSRWDTIRTVDESESRDDRNIRLKIFLNKSNGSKEVLNVRYQPVDNTYRTHLAFLIESGKRKLVIYDTINENQFFFWNGAKLVPASVPSVREKEIRTALGYNDDTGGFHTKKFYPFLLIPTLFIYYFCLILFGILYLYKKHRNQNLP